MDLTEANLARTLAQMAALEQAGIPIVLRPTTVTLIAGERLRTGQPVTVRDGKAYKS